MITAQIIILPAPFASQPQIFRNHHGGRAMSVAGRLAGDTRLFQWRGPSLTEAFAEGRGQVSFAFAGPAGPGPGVSRTVVRSTTMTAATFDDYIWTTAGTTTADSYTLRTPAAAPCPSPRFS
jgi:hypothetical protein